MRKKDLLFRFYCLGSILFLLYCSGNFFVMDAYSTSIPIFWGFEVIFVFLLVSTRGNTILLSQKSLLFILLSVFVFFASMAMNSFEDLSSYIAIILQMSCALIISTQINEELFKEEYIKIITVFAVISLVFYILSIISPSIAYFFPKTDRDDLNLSYYNAFVYVFWEETGWSISFLSRRNAGIFWEPGVYQAFLNYALFLLLSKKKYKHRGIVGAILIATILTTYSVTGYMVALFLLTMYLFWKGKRRFLIILVAVGITLLFVLGLNNIVVVSKLFDGKYISERISLPQIASLVAKEEAYLFGFTFTGRDALGLSSTVWNSIIDSCYVFGIPYVVVLLICYYKSCRRSEHGLLLFFCLMIFFSVESFIWRPFFLLIIFYGLYPNHYHSQPIKVKEMELNHGV